MRFSHAYHGIFVMAWAVLLWTAGAMRTRQTRHDNSSNLSFPSKPSLQLSFSGVLQDGQNADGFSVKVTADESQLMILMEDAAAKDSNVSWREVKDRTLLDVKNNARHEHQHFFDERVCYTFDLFPSHGVMQPLRKFTYLQRLHAHLGAGTPTSSPATETMPAMDRREEEEDEDNSSVTEEKMTKEEMNHLLFMGALSDVFQVPLHFYAMANTSEGVKNLTDGLSCQLWSLNQTHHMPVGIMLQALTATNSIPTASPFWWVSSALEDRDDVKTLMERLDLEQMKGGVATMTAAFEFCVTEKGDLLSAESLYRLTYQRAHQEDNETSNETRTSADEEEKIMTIFEQKKATKLLHTSKRPPLETLNATEGVAGGACADLTQGSTGEQELEEDLNGEKRLQRINREAEGHWDAGAYDFWDGLKVKEILSSLGTEIGPLKLPLPSSRPSFLRRSGANNENHEEKNLSLPERFDARKEWPTCNSIGLIRNQGRCGSCWAMAAATVMTDRFCVAAAQAQRGLQLSQTTKDATKALQDLQGLSLAPELLVQCDLTNNGCGGGRLDDAWTYLKEHGIPKEACAPYMHCPVPTQTSCGNVWERPHFNLASSGNRSISDICHGHCADGSAMHFFKVTEAYAVAKPRDMNSLQRELMQRGPVEVAFFVFSDFMNYRRGVYFRTPGAYGPLGGHAVRLLGWGIEEEYEKKPVDYWLIANSYSPRWGMHGLFKIRRGSNECGIESTPAAGTPDLKAVFVQ